MGRKLTPPDKVRACAGIQRQLGTVYTTYVEHLRFAAKPTPDHQRQVLQLAKQTGLINAYYGDKTIKGPSVLMLEFASREGAAMFSESYKLLQSSE
jgi:hypothetical protein